MYSQFMMHGQKNIKLHLVDQQKKVYLIYQRREQ